MSYDFNKREDYDYSHSYDYFGGVGLGREEVRNERQKQALKGKYDLEPVDPPSDSLEADEVIRLAALIHQSKERQALLKKISELKDRRMEPVWNQKHQYHKYFEWALHCLDREVEGWRSIRKGATKELKSELLKQSEDPVTINCNVSVSGLKARPELNGKIGKVISENSDKTRWFVEFTDINQTVSISKSNCSKTKLEPTYNEKILPNGLKVEIARLSSEQGKLLNGLECFVLNFDKDSCRYMVRVELTGEHKAIKEDNLHVPTPNGWTERFDSSSGKSYFINDQTGETTWVHPILRRGPSKRKSGLEPKDEFVRREDELEEEEEPPATNFQDEETGFDRNEFLRKEEKRLRLDKKRSHTNTDVKEIIKERLGIIRSMMGVEPVSEGPIFIGTPKILLDTILLKDTTEDRKRWLFIGLGITFEDFQQLKFNKQQLSGLLERIDQIIEEKGEISSDMESWVVSALKLAIPQSYTIS
jgi:hypothetical protein